MPPAVSAASPAPSATVQKSNVRYAATSFTCDRETRELGEDYPELQRIARAYRLLERRLIAAQRRLGAGRSLSAVMDFSLALADADHDASLGSMVALAREAFIEARVVKIAPASSDSA